MLNKRIALIVSVAAALAAGTGAALAATSNDDGNGPEQAIIDNAAKRLNVTPEALRNALGSAADDQLDQAVKDGKLTQAQADAIKERRKEHGSVLGFGPGFGPRGHGHGPGMFGLRSSIDELATALGTTPAKLHESLGDGKTIAEIANENGKDLADVKKAVVDAVSERLDKAVENKRLTKAQADELRKRAGEMFDRFATSKPSERRHPLGERGGPMGPGPGDPGGDSPPGIAF